MDIREFPIPPHFIKEKVGEVWRVDYQKRSAEARDWARKHNIVSFADDRLRVALLAVDCQNTFCIPEFELFVGGRSGNAAVEDNTRLCEFIYRNIGTITSIYATMDTHAAMQIFHPLFLINKHGDHPAPLTEISLEEVESGAWRVNPDVAKNFPGRTHEDLNEYLRYYCRQLVDTGKYTLMIWPYHAIRGGIGHALVSGVEEAMFFHAIARRSQTRFEVKGGIPLTENYSALRPEVLADQHGKAIARSNERLFDELLAFDRLIIAGQAKSHCVAWTIADLLEEIGRRNEALARKLYLLEDCTSPVVVPHVVDFTEQADAACKRFAAAGVNLVKSTTTLGKWPGMN